MRTQLKSFWRDEFGGLTPGFLIFLIGFVVLCGAAMNLKSTRIQKTRIEGVAQAIALELVKGLNNPEISKQEALKKAFQAGRFVSFRENIKAPVYSNQFLNVLDTYLQDITTITYGHYDAETLKFTADPSSMDAVMVEMEFSKAKGNALVRQFYDGLGTTRDLTVRAVADAYVPTCSRGGLFANTSLRINGTLDIGWGNCVRSNGNLILNIYVAAGPNVEISVPDKNNLSGAGAPVLSPKILQFRSSRNKEFYYFDHVLADMMTGRPSELVPNFYVSPEVLHINAMQTFPLTGNRKNFLVVKRSDLPPNRIIRISNCKDNTLLLAKGDYDRIVLISDCPMDMLRGAVFSQAIVLNTRQGGATMDFRNDAVIGDGATSCDPNAGVLIWSLGQIDFRSDLKAFDAQVISGRLLRNPDIDPFNPDRPLAEDTLASDVAGIEIGNRAFLHGSTFSAHKYIRILNRAVMTRCSNPTEANRLFRKYFRVGLI